MSKSSKISVPDALLCDKKVKCSEIYLYMFLKMTYSSEIGYVNIYSKNLLDRLHWKDNKTLKKYLFNLKQKGYISYEFENIPKFKPMIIHIRDLDIDNGEYFTWIDRETIYKIIDCSRQVEINNNDKIVFSDLKESSIRLFYYLKKRYVVTDGYCCPSYSDINRDLGIRDKNIKAIINNLVINKLIYITIGKRYVNENGNNVRERNKYKPICKMN